MSTLPEQFSEARKTQVAAQFELFRSFSSNAVESAEKMLALNMSTGRAAVEQSTAAMRQLIAAKDPRDLLALTTQTQQNFETFLAYSRALFNIAAGTRITLPQAAAAPLLPAATPPATTPAPPAQAAHPAASAEPGQQAPSVMAEAAPPSQDEPAATAEPIAKTSPIAQAVSEVIAAEAPEHPAAAPVAFAEPQPVAVSGIAPVDAAPPPAPVSGKPAVSGKQAEAANGKASKKK